MLGIPYDSPDLSTIPFLASLYRKGRISLDDLIAAGVDPDDVYFVARTRGSRVHHHKSI
jgi:hypothetical protein